MASFLRPLARSCARTASPIASTPFAAPPRALFAPLTLARAKSSHISTRFTSDHEWTTLDSHTGIATVGVTDYAQKALGDVVFVELPTVGTDITKGEECGSIESVKAASEIYAPLSGEIREVNSTLDDQPNLINKSPEEKGWLFRVKLSNPGEFGELLSEDGYKGLIE